MPNKRWIFLLCFFIFKCIQEILVGVSIFVWIFIVTTIINLMWACIYVRMIRLFVHSLRWNFFLFGLILLQIQFRHETCSISWIYIVCVCECVQTNRSTANIIQIFYFVLFLGSSFISCVFHKKWETENQTLNGATYWTTNEFLFIVYPFRLPRFAFSSNKRGRYCNRPKKSSKAVLGKTSRKNQSSVCDTTWSVFSLQFQMFA